MREADWRSIRLLVDLQACQTPGSRGRGVGRYSTSLFGQLAKTCAPRDLFALEAAHLPSADVPANFPQEKIIRLGPLPDWQVERDYRGGEQDSLDAVLHTSVCADIAPDVIHISHVFEGLTDRIALPSRSELGPGQILSATLYDLIPLRFTDHYFSNPLFERWYRHRLALVQQTDLLLAISESSRRDAIDLLGLHPDRIVTIHGGVADHFRPLADLPAARERLQASYGICRTGYVLYTGGDEYRKNLKGAILGFAALPLEVRKDRHLVLICSLEPERKQFFEACALKAGLSRDDVLFLGFVPEDDLVAFYGTCDLFFFPSLYEGLGFPVLEAMACGAPVIGGDNSAIRETIGRADALFDAGDPAAIARSIQQVLAEPQFAKDLRRHGMARSKEFTWRSSAEIALEAFDDALQHKRTAGCLAARAGWLPRKRIAMFTPLPPCRSGIADYNAHFLPYLAEHLDIDLYIDDYAVADTALTSAFRIFSARDFPASASAYDAILYEFGNSEFHAHMLPLLAEFPGIVGLHDAFLSGLMGYLEFKLRDENRYGREMVYAHAGLARRYLAPAQARTNAIAAAMVELPCSRRVLDQAIGVISHSPFNLKIAQRFYPEGWLAPYRIIPQMMPIAEPWSEQRILATRTELGFSKDDFIVATFGHIVWTKCGDRILEAFLRPEVSDDRRCRLVFVGELAKDDFGRKIEDAIRQSGHADRIEITGFLTREDYERYLRIADVAIQLRTKSRGGTPRGVLDALAVGLPVIVNSEASYEDYPDDVVLRISPDPGSEEIASTLAVLRGDRARRARLTERGRQYLREQHDPDICAAQYAAAIHEFAARNALRRTSSHAKGLAPHLAGCPDQAAASRMAALFLDSRPVPSFERSRLFIDVSHIAQGDQETGIQRVVKETVSAAYCSRRPGFEAVAVERLDDQLFVADRWLKNRGLLLPHEVTHEKQPSIAFRPGDRLLMLDSSWDHYSHFDPIFTRARSARVSTTT